MYKLMTGNRQSIKTFLPAVIVQIQLDGSQHETVETTSQSWCPEIFFSQRVVKEWNLLPQEVVDATSVNQFKNRLDKFCQRYGH